MLMVKLGLTNWYRKSIFVARKPGNYIGFAEVDAKKVQLLWKNGHHELAIGFVLLKLI